MRVCSQRSTRACWDDHFEHIPWHIAEEQHTKLPSLGCLFRFTLLISQTYISLYLYIYIYHISTSSCHVYIYYLVRLHRNCEKKIKLLEMELYTSKLQAIFSLPRVVQQRHLRVQRNADFVVCCQPEGRLGHGRYRDLRVLVMESHVASRDA